MMRGNGDVVWQRWSFQFKAGFIKDDVCAYVDNIVSFQAYDEFHSVCLFVWFGLVFKIKKLKIKKIKKIY